MNVSALSKIRVRHDTLKSKRTPTVFEKEENRSKLLNNEPYTLEDINKLALLTFKNNKLDSTKYFLSFDGELIKTDTEKLFNSTNPIFCIYSKEKNSWALFCFLKNEENVTFVLCIDSDGSPIPFQMEQKMLKRDNNIKIINYPHGEKHEVCMSGSFCIINLNFMLTYYMQDKKNFIESFAKLTFCKLIDIQNIKISKIRKLTVDLAENEDFLKELKKTIDDFPTDFGKDSLDFIKARETEVAKGKDGYDPSKLEEKRKKLFDEENLKSIKEKYKDVDEGDNKKTDYTLNIEKNYPKEMKQFGHIFKVLERVEIGDGFYHALKTIAEILKLDFDKLKMFYTFSKKKHIEDLEDLPMASIEEIMEKTSEYEKSQTTYSASSDCTPVDQLLKEIVLGIDGSGIPYDDDIAKLEKNFNLIKEKMMAWSTASTKNINDWAKQKKGKLTESVEDICTAIAVINRAFNLLKNFSLRDTQFLAALTFLLKPNQGILVQIQTGQGKTITVAILAIIKVLQGTVVDVITSNPILAQEGVDETKDLYNLFNLTVSTNNINTGGGEKKIGYKADVLYGTISNFQFDFLKNDVENLGTRWNRKFGQVILDEVDSMLVDNGGHIAKLAQPFPGMETFRYIYINIWNALQNADEEFKAEMTTKIQNKIAELNAKEDEDLDKQSEELTKYIEELCSSERQHLQQKIKATNPLNIPFIPRHLQSYAKKKLDLWINNAIHAKYNCHEHQQYRVIVNENTQEQMIAPVDYRNTGITMKTTIWSNGLHQFLQLKHNFCLTYESLTSSFISNIGYIKNYPQGNIFGMTGTLGSTAEQKLLAGIYGVTYAKLPPYKPKVFEEWPGLVYEDKKWDKELVINILDVISKERAVLVLCETGADLFKIKTNLELLQKSTKIVTIRIRVFANEDDAGTTKEKVQIGDVILSTNIAGRGTNFKTTKDLEAKGGLHVLVGFLPCNQRVQGQAFGRTSRQGNSGTAQLIIRQSELEELKIPIDERNFGKIKFVRDYFEQDRLKDISENLVKELDFKDAMFKDFAKLYRRFKRENHHDNIYVVNDLKEFWAFWLENKNYTSKNIGSLTPKEEFRYFKDDAKSILDKKISHNPYNCILMAEKYMENHDYAKAKQFAYEAIDLAQNNLMVGAYVKLFEIAMYENNVVTNHVLLKLHQLLFFETPSEEAYKRKAREAIEDAAKAIGYELEYMEKYCIGDKNYNPLSKTIINTGSENIFQKHLYGRYGLLYIYKSHFDDIVNDIKDAELIYIKDEFLCNFDTFNKLDIPETTTRFITSTEIHELQTIGLQSLYKMEVVGKIDKTIVAFGVGQVAAGLALLAVGCSFPFLAPFALPAAYMLISNGILDIVSAIIDPNQKFNGVHYFIDKLISYGIDIIFLGLSKVNLVAKIAKKVVDGCRKIATGLKNFVVKLFSKISMIIGKLFGFTKQILFQAPKAINAVVNVTVHMSAKKIFKDFVKVYWKKLATSLITKVVVDDVLANSVEFIMDNTIKLLFKQNIIDNLKRNAKVCKKIAISSKEKISIAIEGFFTYKMDEVFNIACNIAAKFKNTAVKVILAIGKCTWLSIPVIDAAVNFASYFDNTLESDENSKNHSKLDEIADDIMPANENIKAEKLEFQLEEIAEEASTKMCEKLIAIIKVISEPKIEKLVGKGVDKFENYAGYNSDSGNNVKIEKLTVYDTIGVDKNASNEEVSRAYLRRLMGTELNDYKDARVINEAYDNILKERQITH